MTNNRHLKSWIEHLLRVITMFLIVTLTMVNDFKVNLATITIFIIWITLIILNCHVLKKYGRGLWIGNE